MEGQHNEKGTTMGTYDDLFSGDDCTRCPLHRADVYLIDGEIDWFALA